MSLTEGPVYRRLLSLWLPMIFGVVAVKLIDLSDAWFVGKLGEAPLAAISFTFPVVLTLISLSIGLSAGASSVLSRAIGNGRSGDELQRTVSGALSLSVAVSLGLSITGALVIAPLLQLMGASGPIFDMALEFMLIWLAGTIFLILPVVSGGLLRAAGDGLTPALIMGLIAILNIGLNPVFIFGVGPVEPFGMAGAAVATVIARAVATGLSIWLLWRRGLLTFATAAVRRGIDRWQEIAHVGLPASVSTSINPVSMSIATAAVATLGASEVAAFGVATRIEAFALVPLLALSSAIAPVVGQNSGAGETERSRVALWWCAGIAIGWTLLAAVVLAVAAPWLAGSFSDVDAVADDAAAYLTIVPLSLFGYGIVIAVSAAMNGLGRPGNALALTCLRALGLLAPLAWLGVLLGFGFAGVAAAIAVANVLTGLIGLAIIRRHGLEVADASDDREASPA